MVFEPLTPTAAAGGGEAAGDGFARCHDHKLGLISPEGYYALTGIFRRPAGARGATSA